MRTDKYIINPLPECVPAEFARELERENARLREAINEVISRPDFTTPQTMIHRLSACITANQ